jgi:hypothetical protein
LKVNKNGCFAILEKSRCLSRNGKQLVTLTGLQLLFSVTLTGLHLLFSVILQALQLLFSGISCIGSAMLDFASHFWDIMLYYNCGLSCHHELFARPVSDSVQ